jgi:iron complex transport system substrate-binding protein
MRICSLLPGATEVIAALGSADQLVGISHECDFPAAITHLPVMIEPSTGHTGARSAEIDRQVKEMVAAGERLYQLNEPAFQAARPDLILTQDLCHVCAITPDQLHRSIQSLSTQPTIVTLSPSSIEDMLADIGRIAQAIGKLAQGQAVVQDLRQRLATVSTAMAARTSRPRVVCLEWLAPLYVAGHWVPEMIELAGGQDVLGAKHAPSRETTWQEVEQAAPDILLLMPCGYPIERTLQELLDAGPEQNEWRRAAGRYPQIHLVDAASYFSRPGPRLIEGIELLAAILQPDHDRPIDPMKARRLDAATLG